MTPRVSEYRQCLRLLGTPFVIAVPQGMMARARYARDPSPLFYLGTVGFSVVLRAGPGYRVLGLKADRPLPPSWLIDISQVLEESV